MPAPRRMRVSGRKPARSRPAAAPSALAKIEPPRVSKAHPRARVFGLLDEVSDRRVIWVCAPAGYGKTTAVASWLEHRSARAVWYHCDDGDADIASFLHFLSITVASASDRESSPLLSLTPDLYPALTTFVRNYFRAYFARLAAGGARARPSARAVGFRVAYPPFRAAGGRGAVAAGLGGTVR